jgi:hypothetical protein
MMVGMKKRILISGLWFLSMWGMGGALHVFLDVPRVAMLIPAIMVALAWWIGLARYDARREAGHAQMPATGGYRAQGALQVATK